MAVLDPAKAVAALRMMMLIRAFEAALARRRDHGFQLLSEGEEAVAVGLAAALMPEDQLLTGGRSIGPALARGLDPAKVLAELLGRMAGFNRGRAGRGHLAAPAEGFFGAHAVVGGNISIAAGVALARQLEGKPGIVAILFGDGACAAGVLHECLNIAAIWRLPLLFLCNNNQLSVATPRGASLAPVRLSDLGQAYGIPGRTVDGMDVELVSEAARAAAAAVRTGGGPYFLECVSWRFGSHSTTARETRPRAELAAMRMHCPVARLTAALRERGVLDEAGIDALDREVAAAVARAVEFADAAAMPEAEEALCDVY